MKKKMMNSFYVSNVVTIATLIYTALLLKLMAIGNGPIVTATQWLHTLFVYLCAN